MAPEFAKFPVLQVRLQLAAAAIHQYHYKDFAAASKIYQAILEEHKRVEHPNLRLAGIRWGDLFAESGDLVRAAETYRIAATLGGEKFAGTALTEASSRGALMRIAEQKLKGGEIQATRQLLERLELEYPGRRLDGLYCFLRAETDRHAGRYEDACRYYEMIFKLPQWAGYRDRATQGIADCYYRAGTEESLIESLKTYRELKENFPKYHEEKKGAAIEKLIAERLARIKKAKDQGDAEAAFFRGFSSGFEPDEKEWFGKPNDFAVVRAPGLQGPHTAMLDAYPREVINRTYDLPLTNLVPGGTYWVEIWYRDLVRPALPTIIQPNVQVLFTVEGPVKDSVAAPVHLMPRNSHHQWHKLTFKLKSPLAQDCKMTVNFNGQMGVFFYDALSIRPVSDRQLDSLINFLEGGKTP